MYLYRDYFQAQVYTIWVITWTLRDCQQFTDESLREMDPASQEPSSSTFELTCPKYGSFKGLL